MSAAYAVPSGGGGGNGGSFLNKQGMTIGIFVGIIFVLCLLNYINTGKQLLEGKKSNKMQYVFACMCSTAVLFFVYSKFFSGK